MIPERRIDSECLAFRQVDLAQQYADKKERRLAPAQGGRSAPHPAPHPADGERESTHFLTASMALLPSM
jgi:hypothetical protein